VTCEHLRANVVIVAGAVRGDITAEKVEIRSTGRVWGDVVTAAFATEEGAFLRGQIRMEDEVDIGTGISPDEEDAQIEVPGTDEPDESSDDETPSDGTSADDTSTDVPSTEEPSLEEPSEGDQET
jgi:hypothetical protein